jgi:hypothetical protein
MPINEFALNYQKQVILNYAQMHELNKVIAARLAMLFSKISSDQYNEDDEKDYDRESIQILVSVSRLLDPLIEQAVLQYEEQLAKEESKDLDDLEKFRKFLEDDQS